MCLTLIKDSKRKTAKRAIKCFKVLKFDNPFALSTPYKSCPIKIGLTYNSKLEFDESYITQTISVGIHSFVNLEDATAEAIDWYPCNTVVVECQIPKGSVYYIGLFDVEDSARKSYA